MVLSTGAPNHLLDPELCCHAFLTLELFVWGLEEVIVEAPSFVNAPQRIRGDMEAEELLQRRRPKPLLLDVRAPFSSSLAL